MKLLPCVRPLTEYWSYHLVVILKVKMNSQQKMKSKKYLILEKFYILKVITVKPFFFYKFNIQGILTGILSSKWMVFKK